MNKETLEQFQQFLTVRHRSYRRINVECVDVSSKIKHIMRYIDDDMQLLNKSWIIDIDIWTRLERLRRLEERLEELLTMKAEQKQLAKRFVARYYIVEDRDEAGYGKATQLQTQAEAFKIINEACGYIEDSVEAVSKPCKDCGEEKLLSEYYNHPLTLDGRTGKCKVCITQATKERNSKRL